MLWNDRGIYSSNIQRGRNLYSGVSDVSRGSGYKGRGSGYTGRGVGIRGGGVGIRGGGAGIRGEEWV